MKIGILEPENFSDEALQKLSQLGDINLFDGLDQQSFLADIHVLFIRLNYLI